MSSIWIAAETGTLTAESLKEFLDKDPGLLNREDGSGLTPLGYALSKGKWATVQLLLDNNANLNKPMGETMGFPDGRTPVYLAAIARSAGPRMMQLLLDKNPATLDQPVPSRKSETPLMAAVARTQDPKIVRMLVDAGASPDDKRNTDGKTARELAEQLPGGPNKTAIKAALEDPVLKKGGGAGGLRAYIRDWVLGVLKYFGVFKPLSTILTAATRFFYRIAPPKEEDDDYGVKEPVTAADFKKNLGDAVASGGLDRFFPPGDPYLDELAKKAAELKNDNSNPLKEPREIQGLANLGLFQTVLYCDDSGSMRNQDRWPKQATLAQRIADIATRAVPGSASASNKKGVHFRFINKPLAAADYLDSDAVARELNGHSPNGGTPIGTQLRARILEPLVYKVLDAGGKLARPYLVMIITDGCPWDEPNDQLRTSVLECGRRLKAAGYRRDAVRFCLSQIGTDDDARKFLDSLDTDEDVQDVLHRTAELLDARYDELRENEKDLQSWLLRMLLSPLDALRAP